MELEHRPEFLTFTIFYYGEEQKVIAHYTSICKVNDKYFWNNCEITTHEVSLESDIGLAMKFERDYLNHKEK